VSSVEAPCWCLFCWYAIVDGCAMSTLFHTLLIFLIAIYVKCSYPKNVNICLSGGDVAVGGRCNRSS
jgi:hypothetical protein